jgi:hypothetical protein
MSVITKYFNQLQDLKKITEKSLNFRMKYKHLHESRSSLWRWQQTLEQSDWPPLGLGVSGVEEDVRPPGVRYGCSPVTVSLLSVAERCGWIGSRFVLNQYNSIKQWQFGAHWRKTGRVHENFRT